MISKQDVWGLLLGFFCINYIINVLIVSINYVSLCWNTLEYKRVLSFINLFYFHLLGCMKEVKQLNEKSSSLKRNRNR